jgi:hypothetical protein
MTSFLEIERFLASEGPWITGIDFPFGQPHKLIINLGWPQTWEGYVDRISRMSREEFCSTLSDYKWHRPEGDKEHRRVTDEAAGSLSPQKLSFTPVGRMFFQGAPRLMNSGVCIIPCRPTATNRIVVEAYPALVARFLVGRCGYKHDQKHKQTAEHRMVRADIVHGLSSPAMRSHYSFEIELTPKLAEECIANSTGDRLDAMLCAVQAAWAWSQRDANYGMPVDCDAAEGWITDPALVQR